MTLLSIVLKEIRHRSLNFVLATTSVTVSVACVVGIVLILRVFDVETETVLSSMSQIRTAAWARYKDEMRKDMLDLGFNLMILHKDHQVSSPTDKGHDLPESYADRLAASGLTTINHVLPFLQQKVWWKTRQRWITLVGTGGEVYIKNPAKQTPMFQRVPVGHAVLGYSIHQSLDLKEGDQIVLLGRRFKVKECLPARSFHEDEQIWIQLKATQELLNKPSLITGMLAINCRCKLENLWQIKEDVARRLPGTRVVEHNDRLVTRARARSKVARKADEDLAREKLMRHELRAKHISLGALVVPLVVLVSMVMLGILAWLNVQQRRSEIGLLGAVGMPSSKMLALFVGRSLVVGVTGAAAGLCLGVTAAGLATQTGLSALKPADIPLFLLYLAGAVAMSALASSLPALIAARIDPALVLQEE